MKNFFVSLLLKLIIISLVAFIAFFGYTIYNEIVVDTGDNIVLLEDMGEFVSTQTTSKKTDSKPATSDEAIFVGIQPTNTTNNQSQHVVNVNTTKYLYNQLDKTAKIIYSKLYQNKDNLKTGTYTIEFGNAFSELLSQDGGDAELQKQYQSAIEALIYENPDMFYIDATDMYINIEKITKITGTKYNVYINSGDKENYLSDGFFTKADVDMRVQEIEQERDKIVTMVNGKSDYEKIKIIHDYLIDSIEYETSISENNIYNIYGALIEKKCVCEGYAKAYQYLLNEIGIDNVIVIGIATNSRNDTENHAWNYVKLNGNWYAIDVTWDDPVIIGGGRLTNNLRYQFFLKGSRTMDGNHVVSKTFTDGGQEFEYPELSIQDYK